MIRYKEGNVDLFNLEAAHIKPQAHQGTFLPCNGIAMCRDMHFAFDKGFFCISDDYRVIVSEKLKGNWFYEEYNGKYWCPLKLPFSRARMCVCVFFNKSGLSPWWIYPFGFTLQSPNL